MIIPEGLMYGRKPELELPEDGSVWIAGGAIRRWFTGEKQDPKSDIDLFAMDFDRLTAYAKGMKFRQVYDTKNATTYKWRDQTIQTIKLTSPTPEESMAKFDFKHCQFAYDGKKIYATDEAVICSLRKHLMFNNMLKGYEVDTLRRAFKYQREGYTPCGGTLRDLARALRGLTEEEIAGQGGISSFFD